MKTLTRFKRQAKQYRPMYKYGSDGDYPNWMNIAAAGVLVIAGLKIAIAYVEACAKLYH